MVTTFNICFKGITGPTVFMSGVSIANGNIYIVELAASKEREKR